MKGDARPHVVLERKTVDWLLEEDQPSIRYLALTQLLGKKESDPEVRRSKARISKAGWAADLLARRDPAGWWERDKGWMEPRFTSTHWTMLALADLGATRAIPEVAASAEYWMAKSPLEGGGVGGFGKRKGHHCYTANMARGLLRLGYEDDPRVRKTLDWIVRTAHPNGGWSCRYVKDGPATSRTLDAWEGLAAFAAFPRSKWTPAMKVCVERAAEYYLEHELHVQGERYEPWYRFHWPVHYYYDLLVGLDCLTALGFGHDPRLGFALDLLRGKRRPDGRWNMDAFQPDPYQEFVEWFETHPGNCPAPLTFEKEGTPSKMITLRALTVLSRVG
jgi:hypothetical protein